MTGASTPNWIDFREDVSISPTTIFTDLKEAFGLSPNDNMQLVKKSTDWLGFTNFRYQQYYKQIKVVYGEFFVHQQPDGSVRTANGRLITGLNLGTEAQVNEAQALSYALHFVGAKKYLWENPTMENQLKKQEKNEAATYFPKGQLVVAPGNYETSFRASEYRLVWSFKIYTDGGDVPAKEVYVDALTGKVVRHVDISMSCAGGTGGSAFNGNVSFSTELNGGSYRSHNDCQATDIYVYNCNRGVAANNFYTDADNAWTDASAVQAQWGALMTYNYYIGQHSRASWDAASGNMVVYNNAVYGNPATANNACWGCYGNVTIFGAGNTTGATDDWNTDDIMGHEFTHGVTQAEANLDYSKESGGLNESFSDIFGEMIESWSEGNCDYLIGADRGAIRSMISPKTYGQPDTYGGTNWYNVSGCTPGSTNDNCGVHTNSGVQNRWFYLLSEGGSGTNDLGKSYSVTGITRFKARLIAYRALSEYLNSSSAYIDARAASLHAALDLYGQCSPEIIAVGDAWHAVGVESQSAQFLKNACGTYSAGEFVQSISQLTAASGCTTTVNSATNTVYFTARDRVILYPGFKASAGSKFVAYLEPCSSTMWRTANNDRGIVMSDAEKGIKPMTPVVEAARKAEQPLPTTGITVSPNPFSSTFNLSINWKQDEKMQVNVYNAAGVKVLEKQGVNLNKGANQLTFNGSNLAKGVYMVEINIGETRTLKKVVKM